MINKITSTSNNLIKQITKLDTTKHILELGMCFVEGEKLVWELYENGLVDTVLITEKKQEEYNHALKFKDCNVIVVNEIVSNKISQTKTNAGVFALCKLPVSNFTFDKPFLVLDGIQDPSNLGSIIRSAIAFDFNNIVLLNCCYPYLPKVIRSSMGYVFKTNFLYSSVKELEECQNKYEFDLYCADMNGEDVATFSPKAKLFGIVLGNEGKGVSNDVKVLCKNTISIAMQNGVESLNVGVSASIIMYQLNEKSRGL